MLNRISIIILVLFAFARANAEILPLRVVVDGVKLGDIDASLNEKGQPVSVRASQFIRFIGNYLRPEKLSRIQNAVGPEDLVTVETLSRVGIPSRYSEKELQIEFEVPLEARAVRDFPLVSAKTKTGLLMEPKPFSGFLNMFGSAAYTTQTTPLTHLDQRQPITGRAELVQNIYLGTIESSAQYQEYDKTPWYRQDTSFVHDFEDQQWRLRLGDYNPGIQGFQNSISANGIQFQKQFSIYPDRNSTNKRSANIMVKNNSLMEIFVNGNLVLRTRVNAGPYNLKDLPLTYGSNKLRVVLHDDFGGQEEFLVDLLFDDQILAKDTVDFSYQAGKPSYFSGLEKKYYEDNLSSLFQKYGLTDNVTLFFNHQNYRSSNLWGAGFGYLTPLGTNFFDFATYTDHDIKFSQAARWRYNSPELNLPVFTQFRIFGSAEARTKDFKQITATIPSYSNFYEKYDVILQKQLAELTFFSVGFNRTHGQNYGLDDFAQRVTFQSQFTKNWRFDVTYNWFHNTLQNENQVLFTLNWQEAEGKAQAAFAHNSVDNESSVRVVKNSRFNYDDFQLSMYGSKSKSKSTGDQSQNIEAAANYYATKYELRMQSIGNSTGGNLNSNSQLGLGTALAWTTDSFSFSRPISDAFVAIEPEGLGRKQYLTVPNGVEKDNLRLSNNENFVFANVNSYVDRPIQLDSTGLGTSSKLDREAYIAHPKYRTGIFVPLKVIRSLVLRGKLQAANAEDVSYLYGRVLTEDGKVFSNNFFTDESGNFIVDGLSYGKYQIELSDSRYKKVSFELVDSGEAERAKAEGSAEDSEASEYELGTVRIEKEAGR